MEGHDPGRERAPSREAIQGFTLIELMVVVGLISIMMAITYPNLARLVGGYRVEGAARGLMIDLQKTRFRAVTESQCFKVIFDTSAKTYEVRKKSTPCNSGTFITVDIPARKIDETGSVTISSTVDPVFDTRGGVVTPLSTITLQGSNNASRVVKVRTSGRIDIQ